MPNQILRPNSDVDNGDWTDRNGNTTTLWDEINDDSELGSIEGYGDSGIAKFGLTNPSEVPGVNTGHVVKIVAKRTAGSSATTLLVYLKQGSATTISTGTFALTTSNTQYTLNVLEAEAANITDYDALQLWFDVQGTSHQTHAIVYWAQIIVPDADLEITGDVGTATFSGVEGSPGVNIYISGDTGTVTFSVVEGTVTTTTPLSTWRDVFVQYNNSTDSFHVGQIDMTHNVFAGAGPSSSVAFNHFIYKVEANELYRFKYDDTYPSAFIDREGLTTAELGGAYFDRPDSVIFGFWSYGAWPDLDTPNATIVYEASLPRDLTTVPTTNGYPFYGESQPEEECFFLVPPNEFDNPFSLKTLRRITLWLIPPGSVSDSVTVSVTVYPHAANEQGNAGTSVLQTKTMTGYNTTNTGILGPTPPTTDRLPLPQPVKRIYLDFDEMTDPEAGEGSVCGTAFEIKVKLSTAIGIWRMAVEVEDGGDVRFLEYQS